MRLIRWRKREAPDLTAGTKNQASEDDAKASLEEAEATLEKVQEQKKHAWLIAETLSAIRKENHFKDIWNEGLRGE